MSKRHIIRGAKNMSDDAILRELQSVGFDIRSMDGILYDWKGDDCEYSQPSKPDFCKVDKLASQVKQAMKEEAGEDNGCYETISPSLVPINRLLKQRDDLAMLAGDMLATLKRNKVIMFHENKAAEQVFADLLSRWQERFAECSGNPNEGTR